MAVAKSVRSTMK